MAAEILMALRDIWFGFRSPHRVVRKASFIFVFSVAALGFTLFQFTQYQADADRFNPSPLSAHELAELHMKEVMTHAEENQKKKMTDVDMGRMLVKLRAIAGKASEGIWDSADIGISMNCSSPETREFIAGKKSVFKDALISIISQSDRETILTREGKKHLKKQIVKRVNKVLAELKSEHRPKVNAVSITYLEVH